MWNNQKLKNIMNDPKNWVILLLGIGTIVLTLLFNKASDKLDQKDKLIEQIDKKPTIIDGGLKSEVIESDLDNFIDHKTDDPRIKELQEEVKKYKKQLKDKGSIVITDNTLKYDTIYKSRVDTIRDPSNHVDTISNNYIFSTFGRKNDSVLYSLSIRNKQKTVISEQRQGLFKPKKLIIESTNSNPYFTMEDIVSYQTIEVKPSRWGVGVHAGIGTNGQLKPIWVISAGINYNIFTF